VAVQWSVPVWMWPLLLVVAAGAVVWTVAVYGRTRPAPGPGLRRALVALRATALGLLVLAVAGPVVSCLGRHRVPAELVVTVEDSGSLALNDAAPDSAAPSRWRRALGEAAALDSLFAARRPEVHRVFLRGNGLQPLRELDPRDSQTPPPTAHGTSLTGLARRLRERLAGRPVRAVVLVSDGAETVRDQDEGRLANAAAALPLHVVGVGAVTGPPDRAVQDVRHPPVVYAGDDVVVDFAVEQSSLPPGAVAPLVVTLRDEQGVVAADTLASADAVVPVELTFRPRGEGLQALQLAVSPLVAERYLENNRATLAVDVRRDRARVLVVAAVPGWDVRFLAQAAARERRLALTVAYPAASGLVLADSLRPWQPPTTAAGWRRWDAVVLTGWTGTNARLDWASLGEAVGQGLGLLVLPSATATPLGDPAGAGPPGALAALLPVDPVPWRWETGPRFATVAASGVGHVVLDGVVDPRGGPGLGQLPPWRQVAKVTARPGATVLLDAAADGQTAAAALPALVLAARGEGRVAWFGARQVWEWAFWELPGGAPAGDAQPARRVLRNLLVWLAGGAGQAGLEFATRPGVYQEGQPIRLSARWLDLRGEPVTDRVPALALRGSGPGADTTAVRTFALAPAPGEPGLSEVEVPPLAPGRYAVRLTGPGEPPVKGAQAELVVTDTSIERTQVRQDRVRLEQLAARAAGGYADAADAAAVAALHERLLGLDWRGAEDQRRRRFDLWSGWPFLAVVVALLGTEWFLRRRHGLL
jgi:hypothetical protein